MSEQLEDIKKHLKGAVIYFLHYGNINIKNIEKIASDIDLLIKRVVELEHDKEHLELIKERQEEEYRIIHEENKRYREALLEILETTMTIKDSTEHSYYAEDVARRALAKGE